MTKRISATQAARKFSDVLDEVEHFNESFEIERHGRPVAHITPVTRKVPSRVLWRDALAALQAGPRPDPDFAADLEALRETVALLPSDPWEHS